MRRALVLSGGGSKGAYEAGFVKTLYEELHQSFEIVTGTSIGALNGALVVQGDLKRLDELWHHLDIDHVFKDKPQLSLNREDFISSRNMTLNFFKSYLKNKGADVTPFYELAASLFNENKFFSSAIDFGLCTVNVESLAPVFVTKKEMYKENAMRYLLASSACFPVFPMVDITGKKYVDGGYFDNLPIDLAMQMGADEVVVCDLHVEAVHPEYVGLPHVIYSQPYNDPGGFMDFDAESLARNRRLGYLDALKQFGKLSGKKYTFKNTYDSAFANLLFQSIIKDDGKWRMMFKNHDTILLDALFTRNHGQSVKADDCFYVILDILGDLCAKNVLDVHDSQLFIASAIETITADDQSHHSILSPFKNWGNRLRLTGFILNLLEEENLSEESLYKMAVNNPEEYLAAKLINKYILYYKR